VISASASGRLQVPTRIGARVIAAAERALHHENDRPGQEGRSGIHPRALDFLSYEFLRTSGSRMFLIGS
jgi:hypothetical protein